MQGLSLFSSSDWTNEQVDWVLRTHFDAEDDDYWPKDSPSAPAAGWKIPVAPGRYVTIEDGTEDLSGFPASVLARQTALLEAPPIRRLSISYDWNENDPFEENVALWIGAVLARTWPVSWADSSGAAWRAWPA